MKNNKFTFLENYSELEENWSRKKSQELDHGFIERNTNWYILDNNRELLNRQKEISCAFNSYDKFMLDLFNDYRPLKWLRFCPGSQYIVESWRCKTYTRSFWKKLCDFIPRWECDGKNWPTELFLLERALGYIFLGVFSENRGLSSLKRPADLTADAEAFYNQRTQFKNRVKRMAGILKYGDTGELIVQSLRSKFKKKK